MSNESAPSGLFDRTIGSGDHKTIGRLWIFAGLLVGLGALVLRLLVALEQLDTESELMFDPSDLFVAWSASRELLIFGSVASLLVGIGTFIVPLQVGASSIAFARGAASAFWTWEVSIALLIASYIGLAVPGGDDRDFVVLWLFALGGAMVSLVWALVCIATTVIGARAPGMKLEMLPLTSWAFFVFALLGILSIPIQVGQLVIAYLDVNGGYLAPEAWGLLSTVMNTVTLAPSIYWLGIPVLGIALDAISVHTGRPLRFHKSTMVAVGLLALCAFGASVTSFGRRTGGTDFNNAYLNGLLLMSLLPILGSLALGGEGLKAGRPKVGVPLGASLLAGLVLLGGAAVALLGAIEPIVGFIVSVNNSATGANDVADLPDALLLNGTTFNAGITAFVVTAALLGALAAIMHWGHKIWGHQPNQGFGSLAMLSIAGGGTVWAVGEVLGGLDGQVALPASAPIDNLASIGNLLVLVGVAGLAAGVGLTLFTAVIAGVLKSGSESEPWSGSTLEWMTSSPPSYGNFETQPTVNSAYPLLTMEPVSSPETVKSGAPEEVSV